MNKVKKQHFVPRFYLENFTNSNNKIFAFDFRTVKPFVTKVENVAHKNYFYDFEPLDELTGTQTVDNALTHFENPAALAFKRIIGLLESGNINKISNKDRDLLAECILIQMHRTVESRVVAEHSARELERQLKSKGVPEDFIREKGLEANNYDSQSHQIYALTTLNLKEKINEISDRYWIYWDNQTKHCFYTSDHPVVGHIHNDISYSAYEFYFPLSSRFGLSILLKSEFAEWADKNNKKVLLKDIDCVKFYNSLIVSKCNRQVYNSDGDFTLVKKMIEQTPSLLDENRQRIARM